MSRVLLPLAVIAALAFAPGAARAGVVTVGADRLDTSAHLLRVGPERARRAHLRFALPRAERPITGLTLRLHARRARRRGLDVLRRGLVVGYARRVRRGWLRVPLDVRGMQPGKRLHLALAARRCTRCRPYAIQLHGREAPGLGPRLSVRLAPVRPGPVKGPRPSPTPRPTPSPSPGPRAPTASPTPAVTTTPVATPTPAPTPAGPAIAISSPAAGGVTDGRPTFSGTADQGRGATLRVYAGTDLAGLPIETVPLTIAGDGTWSTRPPLLAPGDYTALASETDGAGHAGSSEPVPFTVAATVAAAGDIACSPGRPSTPTECQQQATSDLLIDAGYHRVLALGDNQYSADLNHAATLSEYQASYGPSWGRVRDMTSPVLGNHEYSATDPSVKADGYFDYFAGREIGNRDEGWYSFDLGGWHLIALNSNCGRVDPGTAANGCAQGSPQEAWLRADLAANRLRCTLAYWHHPRYSSSAPDATNMAQIWSDLAAEGTELVLSGHAHGYERFAPMDGQGTAAPDGIREFVAATGGEDFHTFQGAQQNSEVHDNATFGVLRLSLLPGSYSWRFVPIAGSTSGFTDAGSGSCH